MPDFAKTLDTLPDNYTVHITYVVDPSPDRTEEILVRLVRPTGASKFSRCPDASVIKWRWSPVLIIPMAISSSCSTAIFSIRRSLFPNCCATGRKGRGCPNDSTDGAETNWLKRSTSRWFYTTFMKVGAVNLQSGAADYRLISRRVAQVFRKEIREHNQFLRGLVSWVGYRVSFVPFTRSSASRENRKYRPATLLNFALNGSARFRRCLCASASGPVSFWRRSVCSAVCTDSDVRDRQRRRARMDVAHSHALLRQRNSAIFSRRFRRDTSALFSTRSKTVRCICSTDSIVVVLQRGATIPIMIRL